MSSHSLHIPPATPFFACLITFYTCRFIPPSWRPAIFVSLLPTLEAVPYATNILGEDVGFTHPSLDIISWIPYGIGHFPIPFVVATFLWLFCTNQALHFWARSFGNMNMVGVII